ncbi:MAG: DUF3160 domain-containing protein, partial [Candidatus Sumerlaeota bacterium]
PMIETWENMDRLEDGWAGASLTPGPIELVEGLKEKVDGKWNLDNALAYLADDYDTLVWIAWLESRVKQPADLENTGRRGFTFLGARAVVEEEILKRVAEHEKWHGAFTGRGNPFTLVREDNKSFRGYPRSFDLAVAMQNNQDARKFLEASSDTKYYRFPEQEVMAREVWLRASRSGEVAKRFRLRLKRETPLPARTQLLLACQKGAEPSRAVDPDVYVWQEAHRLVRLNTMLGFATWLSHERSPATISDGAQSSAKRNADKTDSKPGAGYLDPFPHIYRQLRDVCKRMQKLSEEHLGIPSDAATNRCKKMANLMEQAEKIAKREIKKPERMSAEDAAWIGNWATHLGDILEPTVSIKTGGAREAGASAMLTAVPWSDETRALQTALGPLWRLSTVVAVGDEDRPVTGALFSLYEFKGNARDLMTDAEWRERVLGNTPARPLLLEELIPPPSITSRIEDIVGNSSMKDKEAERSE